MASEAEIDGEMGCVDKSSDTVMDALLRKDIHLGWCQALHYGLE